MQIFVLVVRLKLMIHQLHKAHFHTNPRLQTMDLRGLAFDYMDGNPL
jgi:hypothetical protein